MLAGRGATWHENMHLPVERNGLTEETYFTFSYSPIDGDGAPGGVLCVCSETTELVVGARRLQTLRELAGATSAESTVAGVCVGAAAALGKDPQDLPFVAVYLNDPAGGARLAASHGLPDRVGGWPLPVAGSTALTHLEGMTDWLGAGTAVPDVTDAVLAPIGDSGSPVGQLLVGVSPYRHFDDDYASFVTLCAAQLATAISQARAREAEQRRSAALEQEWAWRKALLASIRDGMFVAEHRGHRVWTDVIFGSLWEPVTHQRLYIGTVRDVTAEVEATDAQATVATALQRALLGPAAVPAGIAVRYEPATPPLEVGGDWYDVVPLGHRCLGLIVGDCVGRGLEAATVMGQLRSAARALMLQLRDPAGVLCALDRFADMLAAALGTTVFCAVVDTTDGTCRYSSAGHLPAVVSLPGGSTLLLDGAVSVPLAVTPGAERPGASLTLPDGATVLIYTDGLVERRRESLVSPITS